MTAVLQAAPHPQRRSRRRALEHAVFAVLPGLVTVWLLLYVSTGRLGAVDFRQDFWVAGFRVLHGGNPYLWTRAQIISGASFPYPALAALLFVPFALIPVGASSVLFTVLCIVSVAAALRLLAPRDWRLYGVVAVWPAVVSGWQTGNLTLLLALGMACLWRYRERPFVAGVLVALLISIKPIVFPLGIWLIATRRYRAAGYAAAVGLAINLVAFTVLGWSTLGGWLHLISLQGDLLYRKGYAVIAVATDVGLSRQAGTVLEVGIGLLVAIACIRAGRRGLEATALAVAVLLMLVASPQVDLHYFALLLVPLAIMRPRLRWSWLVPLALWVCPASQASVWQAGLFWLVVALLVTDLVRLPRPVLHPQTLTPVSP